MPIHKGRLALVAAFVGTPVVLLLLFLNSGESKPNWNFDQYEAKRVDAQARIESMERPTAYALDRLPGEMASGDWSSSINLMDCNDPEENNCFEVDFKSPDDVVQCKWIVSYDRVTARYAGYRALGAGGVNLFEEMPPDEESPSKDSASAITYESNDGSTTSDAIRLIRKDYIPKDASIYSNSQAEWFDVKENALNNGMDVISVKFSESRADEPCEWIVELTPGIHDQYKLIKVNAAESETFEKKGKEL